MEKSKKTVERRAIAEGLEVDAPRSVADVAPRDVSYDEAETFRAVDIRALGNELNIEQQALGATGGEFFQQAQTSFRSVVAHNGADLMGPLLMSKPETYKSISADRAKEIAAQAKATPCEVGCSTLVQSPSRAPGILVKPLPKSPIFELEPVSHFRVCEDGVDSLPQYVDSVLRETLACGVELEAQSAKWRCVHATSFAYITFVVTVYSDGVGDDGKRAYVVEAQRRSGNVCDFMAMYRAMREGVHASARGESPQVRALPSRDRSMAPPPPELVQGLNTQEMAVASFNELLRLESGAKYVKGHEEVVRALAELTAEEENCVALAEEATAHAPGSEGSVCYKVVEKLVELLHNGSVRTSSYAANALAALSHQEACRNIIAVCGGVPALANAVEGATSCEEIGVRRGGSEALAMLAMERSLSDDDIMAVHRFVVTARSSTDRILNSFASEAQIALGSV